MVHVLYPREIIEHEGLDQYLEFEHDYEDDDEIYISAENFELIKEKLKHYFDTGVRYACDNETGEVICEGYPRPSSVRRELMCKHNLWYAVRINPHTVWYPCEHCGKLVDGYTNDYVNVDGKIICTDCLATDSRFERCTVCGRYERKSEMIDGLCRQCFMNKYTIQPWDYRPWPIKYFGMEVGKVFGGIGFELEIEQNTYGNGFDEMRRAKLIKALKETARENEIYFKHDGSLRNGFEIVTMPHTLSEFYNTPLRELLECCKNAGYTSHNSGRCGLHFHLSRSLFGSNEKSQNMAIAKLIYFYDRWYDEICKFARRGSEQANRYAGKHFIRDFNKAKEISNVDPCDWDHDDRYKAINVTNGDTVEVRIIRGTLDYDSFMAAFDFVWTVARNAKRIAQKDMDNEEKWLDGLKPETIQYMNSRRCDFKHNFDSSVVLRDRFLNRLKDHPYANVELMKCINEYRIMSNGNMIGVIYNETTPELYTYAYWGNDGSLIPISDTHKKYIKWCIRELDPNYADFGFLDNLNGGTWTGLEGANITFMTLDNGNRGCTSCNSDDDYYEEYFVDDEF